MDQVTIALEIIRKQLQTQITKRYGVASFSIHIQDGKIVLVKCNQEISVKIGS